MTRLASLFALLIAAWATAAWGQSAPQVYFTEPADGAVVESGPWIRVTGRALGPKPQARQASDVMLVIDVSGSTQNPSRLTVDQEDESVAGSPGPSFASLPGGGSSILDAEVAAAIQFLEGSDRSTMRVGVVTFAGAFDPRTWLAIPGTTNAWVEQPLTSDYDAVRTTLLRILKQGPHGGTDMAAGLRLAIRELLALEGALSQARPGARKVTLLLTDGFPTLPFGSIGVMDPGDIEVTLNAAGVAAKGGIVIHTFCLGPDAFSTPIACSETARITGGIFTPVELPADIVNIFPKTPVGNVELVVVRNSTTGRLARSLSVTPDGDFTAEVPLAPGGNRLVVELHGSDGLRGTAAITVYYREGDVQIDVTKEREQKPDVEQPQPREKQLDLRIERSGPPP